MAEYINKNLQKPKDPSEEIAPVEEDVMNVNNSSEDEDYKHKNDSDSESVFCG